MTIARRPRARLLILCLALFALAVAATATSAAAAGKPTIVLVHGAWAGPSSWDGVAARLRAAGYPVVVPNNPLRSVSGDSAAIARVLHGIDGPIVLVGHSYGGMVISNAALNNPNVKALVYIVGFAPLAGESLLTLGTHDLGSLVPAALVPVPIVNPSGSIGFNVFLNPLLFPAVFAGDLPAKAAAALAAAQHPITLAALSDRSGAPAWKTIPSWYMVARQDRTIAPATERFMAKRAGSTTVEINSAHDALVSHPDAVTSLIVSAAGG